MLVGVLASVAWLSLWPVALALFASPERFRREYGTPQENGLVPGADPEELE